MQDSQGTVVVLVGNPRAGSRTRLMAESLGCALAQSLGDLPTRTIELTELAPRLHLAEDQDIEAALLTVRSASVLVVASPTYKASYTGILKFFLDRLPGGALTNVPTVPAMLAAIPEHAMAADVHLRPLLTELGSPLILPSFFMLDGDMHDLNVRVDAWLHRAGSALRLIKVRGTHTH